MVFVVAGVSVGCGSNEPASAEKSTEPAATATTTAGDGTLVGRWRQVHKCQDLVAALKKAGLEAVAPAVAGDYFPDSTPKQLAQKGDLCKGARPQVHWHFFTKYGQFGSLNQHGEQVDDGPYEIVNDHIFRIGDAEFRYRILDGNTLIVHPLITASDRREALAHPHKSRKLDGR